MGYRRYHPTTAAFLLLLVASWTMGQSLAFVVQPWTTTTTTLQRSLRPIVPLRGGPTFGYDDASRHLSYQPMASDSSEEEGGSAAYMVHEARAKDCVEHVGKCSMEELQQLKNELHMERLESFAMQDQETKVPADIALEHRLLEEELDLQMTMIKEHMHHVPSTTMPTAVATTTAAATVEPNLFPEVEPKMEELPHLKDGTISQSVEQLIHNAEVELVLEESVLGEGVVESLAVCLGLALLWFMPQLIS